jgi:hypothetical protein
MTKIKTLAGTELSEEDIEALADEAERGYDLDKTIGVPDALLRPASAAAS